MILSCGGGGVRGKITTEFLTLLEKDIKRPLHEVFDAFAGTSTGSLISAGLASKMTAQDINENYYSYKRIKKVFTKTWWSYLFKIKYYTDEIYSIIDTINVQKKLFIVTYNYTKRKPKIFTDDFNNALKASIAAPTYFPPYKINGEYYIDGTMCCNNPNTIIFNLMSKEYEKLADGLYNIFDEESESIETKQKLNDIIEFQKIKAGKILFIGTGYKSINKNIDNIERWGIFDWYKHDLLDILMNGDEELNKLECEGDNYLHINCEIEDDTIDNIDEDNFEKLKEYGRDMYEKNKYEVLSFLNIKIENNKIEKPTF
jgi:predicted patatin/cPLA2 family phospholipase